MPSFKLFTTLIFIGMVLYTCGQTANAAEVSVYAGAWSQHIGPQTYKTKHVRTYFDSSGNEALVHTTLETSQFNSVHKRIGIQVDTGRHVYSISRFDNSYYDETIEAGWVYKMPINKWVAWVAGGTYLHTPNATVDSDYENDRIVPIGGVRGQAGMFGVDVLLLGPAATVSFRVNL